jgi:c-di-GMP-binding flagellar brake protein YcgR
MDSSFVTEAKAAYKREENMVHLRTNEDFQQKDIEFLVHYTDDNQGVFDFRCSYGGNTRDNQQYIILLRVLEILKSTQRRQDVKVKTNVSINALLLEFDGKVRIDPHTQKSVQIRAFLRDISAGGIMIGTTDQLAVSQKLLIPFDKGTTPILLTAQVIREQDSYQGERRYGCRFLNLNHSKESVIREYVFRLQLAGKNKARYSDDV